MALDAIDAACTKCKTKFNSVPKQSFLGFQKLECTWCKENITYPLTSSYRTIYWVIFGLMILMIIGSFAQGEIGFPGGFGLAIIFALLRDKIIRKRVSTAAKP